MSGLASFFRPFLGVSKNKLHAVDEDDNAKNDISDDEAEDAAESLDPEEYQQSISQFHQRPCPRATVHDGVNNDSSDASDAHAEDDPDRAAPPSAASASASAPLIMDYKQSRKFHRDELRKFLKFRITYNDNEEDTDQVTNQQNYEEKNHQEDEDLEPETQQQDGPLFPDASTDTNGRTRIPHPVIPHIVDTNGTVMNINEISLHAKYIELSLCSLDKIWAFRATNRNKNHPSRNSEFFQDDGPLSVMYENVLTVKIQQLSEPPANELRQRVEQLHNVNPIHTIKVFFYNGYAEKMKELQTKAQAEWGKYEKKMKGKQTRRQLYVALQSIPAKCVVPSTTRHRDWYESPQYCLCIGDDSRLEIENEHGVRELVRFDAENQGMRIHALVVDDERRTPITEFRIFPRGKNGEVVLKKIEINDATNNQSFIQSSYRKIIIDFSNNSNSNEDVEEEDSTSALDNGNQTEEVEAINKRRAETPRSATASPGGPKDSDEAVAVPVLPVTQHEQQVAARGAVELQAADNSFGSRKRQRAEQKKVPYEKFDQFDLVLAMEAAVKFSDPVNAHKHINTFGAVLSFTQPFLTKRGDWCMTLTLVDDTVSLYEHGLGHTPFYISSVTAVIFVKNNKKDCLPKVRYAGDVVRLHKVKLNLFRGNLQLTSFPGETTTSVVFRGDVDNPDATEQVTAVPSPGAAMVTGEDRDLASKLWKWAQERLRRHATMKIERRFTISDMRPHDSTSMELYGESDKEDLVAMVTAVLPMDQQYRTATCIPPRGFLRLWDGTGPPISDPLPFDSPTAREAVRTGDPPAAALVKLAEIIKKIRKYHKIELLGPPKKLTGRVTTIAVYEQQYWDLINEGIVKVGSFIRLRNIKESRLDVFGISCLIVQDKSSFTPLPDLTFEVVRLIEGHNNRLLRQDPTNPDSGILPLGVDASVGTTQNERNHTIMNQSSATGPTQRQHPTRSLEFRPGNGVKRVSGRFERLQEFVMAPIGSTFEGYVRVLDIYPSQQTLSTQGLKQICCRKDGAPSGDDQYYRFGLHIQDETDDSCAPDVIVSEGSGLTGSVVFGMSAAAALANHHGALFNLRCLLHDRAVRKAEIHSFEFGGCKYFSLDSLS